MSVSRHAPQGVAVLRRMGNVPPVVVMSLGTNDDPRATGTFRNAIRQTTKIAGRSGCVVWPNIVRPPVGGATYRGYNSILAEESRKRRNLRVAEWTKIVARHRWHREHRQQYRALLEDVFGGDGKKTFGLPNIPSEPGTSWGVCQTGVYPEIAD